MTPTAHAATNLSSARSRIRETEGSRRPTRDRTRRLFGVTPVLCAWVAAATVLALLPEGGDAQIRRGREVEAPTPWPPIAIGARFGWDNRANGEVVGVQVRVPVVRSAVVEVVPNADMVFLDQTKEYQYGIDLSLVPGGVGGGLFVSGGFVFRDTPLGSIDPEEPRQTFFGWVATVGGKTGVGPVQLEAVIRWVFLNDTGYQPNAVTLGVNVPLWRPPPPGS